MLNRESRSTHLKLLAATAALFVLSGCAVSSNVQQIDQLQSIEDDPRIVLMPPDIRYYLLTASGLPEPNAEWTTAAQDNFQDAVVTYADNIGADLKTVDADNISESGLRYETLHSAVGITLIQHHFGMVKLPSKNGEFDWSLGPGVAELGERHDADYALFVYYRDYQASGGRVAFALLAAVAGVGVPMGQEMGFASLVDLKTGDIVWFNLVGAGQGELRDPESAMSTVNYLFKDLPTANGPDATE